MAGVVLLTDLFPPDVGGSAELLYNVYARLTEIPITVLTTGRVAAPSTPPHLTIMRRPAPAEQWGIMHPAGLMAHAQRVAALMRHGDRARVVHCGRALPEGLAAWASRRVGGARYVCWAHGEELSYARTSRELTVLIRQVLRGAAAVIANSENTAVVVREFGVPSRKITVVHPGVDAARFRPDAPGARELRARLAPQGEPILLTVGRLQRRKGHDLVIEALASLDHRNFHYVVVGGGEERDRLQDLAVRSGLGDRVIFVGRTGADELPAYYAASDLFVHPNRVDGSDFEGFGIVFLEAAAAAIPVIAGNSGGAPEAVADGITGVLVSGVDRDELAGAIQALLRDDARRRTLGHAARERAIGSFSWDRAAAGVRSLHEAMEDE
jgi:phosphatidylinositol alpha-1,6-mannosyltransferase